MNEETAPVADAHQPAAVEVEASEPEPEPETVQDSIRAALEVGDGLEGKIWRFKRDDPDAPVESVVEEFGISSSSVRYVLAALKALETAQIPNGYWGAHNVSKKLSAFAERHVERLSPAAAEYVANLVDQAKVVADSKQESRVKSSRRNSAVPGIYVYALPHYIEYPVAPAEDEYSSDRTLLKVGKSDVDAQGRVRQQSVTGMPEPPLVLRIYTTTGSVSDVERRIHRLLGAFDHNPNRASGAGKEWFLTSLEALDELASVMGLKTEFNYESDAD